MTKLILLAVAVVLFCNIAVGSLYAESGEEIISNFQGIVETMQNPESARELVDSVSMNTRLLLPNTQDGMKDLDRVIQEKQQKFYIKVTVLAVTLIRENRAILVINSKKHDRLTSEVISEGNGISILLYNDDRWLNDGYIDDFSWKEYQKVCEKYLVNIE